MLGALGKEDASHQEHPLDLEGIKVDDMLDGPDAACALEAAEREVRQKAIVGLGAGVAGESADESRPQLKHGGVGIGLERNESRARPLGQRDEANRREREGGKAGAGSLDGFGGLIEVFLADVADEVQRHVDLLFGCFAVLGQVEGAQGLEHGAARFGGRVDGGEESDLRIGAH